MIDPRQWGNGTRLLALVGALFVAAIVLHGLESLASPESRMAKKNPAGPSGSKEPIRPTLKRVDDWTIEIREGYWHRSTYRFNEDDGLETAEAVYTCLEEAIARDFDEDPTSERKVLLERMKRIRKECSMSIEIPSPPAAPDEG